MKNRLFSVVLTLVAIPFLVKAQSSSPVENLFPKGTVTHGNISYAGDTLTRHLMDVYEPPGKKSNRPLVVFIHGGAWMLNSKYSDMGYMANTVKGFIDSGYVLASIDYRYSTQAKFPAQIQDCNQAVEYLYQHASEYGIDNSRIALIGFSAGGHLASLLGLSNNDAVKEFYPNEKQTHFKIKCVLDFYGPSNLVMFGNNPDTSINNGRDALSLLLGARVIDRPDLAKIASPVTYINAYDPPFFIVQGEKDESVPNTQSILLHSWLTLTGIRNELTIVKGAPHYGPMFDTENIRIKLFSFLKESMK